MPMGFFSWLIELFSLMAACLALFSYIDKKSDAPINSRVRRWLDGTIPFRPDEDWFSIFVDVFDRIYGVRYGSLRFVLMSATSSFTFASLLTVSWITRHPTEAAGYIAQPFAAFLLFCFILVLTNLVPDYLSNCQTRHILRRLVLAPEECPPRSHIRNIAKWLTIDVVLTTLLAATFVIPMSLVANNVLASSVPFARVEIPTPFNLVDFLMLHPGEFHMYFADTYRGGYSRSFSPPYGVFFYTTFFTSLWLWLHVITGLVMRTAHKFLGPDSAIMALFAFKQHPLWAQGAVCAFLCGVVYVAISAACHFL